MWMRLNQEKENGKNSKEKVSINENNPSSRDGIPKKHFLSFYAQK